MMKTCVVAALCLGLLLIVGCQDSQVSSGQAGGVQTAEKSVMCTKCKTVWVKRSEPGFKGIMTYRTVKSMECPDCKSAVANFFATGKLEHTCKTCGEELQACEAHK